MPLSVRMPDLASLEVLLAVANRGSLTAAARDLGLTQQAVSARVASLEARTGVQLLVRSTRGARLTPAGAVAVQWADRLMDVAREVDAGFASLRGTSRTRVKVSASLTIAEHLLPGWLVSLQAAAAQRGQVPIEVVLTATNTDHVLDQVRAGEADLGFVEGPDVPRGVRSKVIGHDELVLVVRPDHRWARRRDPISAAELGATPLVTREPGSGTRDFLSGALLEGGVDQVSPVLELSTSAAVRAAVLAGSAPAVLSGLAVADDLAAGRLRRVPVAALALQRELRAVWVGGRTPPAGAVRDLLAHISARAQHRRRDGRASTGSQRPG